MLGKTSQDLEGEATRILIEEIIAVEIEIEVEIEVEAEVEVETEVEAEVAVIAGGHKNFILKCNSGSLFPQLC